MRSARSLDAPRAVTAPPGAALYESHYLTAGDPAGGRALWLRYTAHKEPGEGARGQLWCTWFDAASSSPLGRRTPTPLPLGAPAAGRWVEIGEAWIGPGGADGQLEDCAWTVGWDGNGQALAYLPSPWLYDRRLPRSNGAALVPDATFAGRLEVGGSAVDLDGWRGMVGHNWGSDHAERWIWLHVPGLGVRDPRGWLDMVLVRVRVGPLLTPWLPSGGLWLDRWLRRITAADVVRGLRVSLGAGQVEVELPRLRGGGLRLEVRLPPERVARWDYSSPGGGGRQVRNCSIASAAIALPGAPVVRVEDRVAVEIGG